MEKISVIIPVYNAGEYLKPCLDSVLAQTHPNLEIFLVDDGSTDGSGGLCDAYARWDSRIRVFHQENRGLSAARNRGLDAASGDYISFVDADDVLAPEMLERMLEAMGDGDMAVCNIRRLSATGAPQEICPMKGETPSGREFAERLLLPEAWFYVTVMNRLYRRELFEHLRFPEGFIHEDEAIVCDLAARCRRVTVISEPLYFYRRTPDSIIRRGVDIRSTDKLTALSRRLILCRKLGWAALAEATAVRFCHTFFDLYFRFFRDEETQIYFARMDGALKAALPGLLAARGIGLRHKCYLAMLRISPKGAVGFRKWKKTLQKQGDF